MYARMFTLVNAEDDTQIFAWGLEIIDYDHTEAIIYRRDPVTGGASFGQHVSAEAALKRWTRLTPMALVWEDDLSGLSQPDDQVEVAGPGRPQP